LSIQRLVSIVFTTIFRFSELALLLPNTDITLIFFGKAAYDLVHNARKNHTGSLATKDVVWSYTAPKKTGGGSIDIQLYSGSENWNRGIVADGAMPDVIVGLNAGLFSYSTWNEPIIFSAM
jgi:hypothetical protein